MHRSCARQKLYRTDRGTPDPIDIFGRVEPDIGGHTGKNHAWAGPQPCTPTFLPLRSRMLRMPSHAKSSIQPTCTPPTMVRGWPASIGNNDGGEKCIAKSTSPRPRPRARTAGGLRTYSMSVNPSARSRSSATYCGATQIAAIFESRMVVVSGGACCANTFGPPKRLRPAADERVASKRRRLCLDCISAFSHLLGFCPMRLSDDPTVTMEFRRPNDPAAGLSHVQRRATPRLIARPCLFCGVWTNANDGCRCCARLRDRHRPLLLQNATSSTEKRPVATSHRPAAVPREDGE